MSARSYPILTMLLLLLGATDLAAQGEPAARKHALLIAIDDYPASSGYDTIHASNDIPLVRAGLLAQGFLPERMELIVNQEATRDGIRAAITKLGERAKRGDVLVLFYAGHGCQITDDNGDEADGYDEAIVPFDAVDKVATSPSESRHLRDDELNRLVAGLRDRVGPTGNVVLLFDACNSGSITRGPGETPVRGRRVPLGPPAEAGRKQESQGTIADLSTGSQQTRGAGRRQAPYVVISACQHYQQDHEIAVENEKGEIVHVGPLAYALSRALPAVRSGATYRSLFEKIKTLMAAETLLQEPQMEGDVDVELFSGSLVDQGSYFSIARRNGDDVVLHGGSLVGLLPGTKVAFHPVGTTDPAASKAIAEGSVISSDLLEATVKLDLPLPTLDDGEPWAFVSEYTFEKVQLRVLLDPGFHAGTEQVLRSALEQSGFVELTTVAPEVIIRRPSGSRIAIELLTMENDTLLVIPDGRGADTGQQIFEKLRGYARAKHLRRLDISDNSIRVEAEIVPIILKHAPDGSVVGIDRIDSSRVPDAGGQMVLKEGDAYMLRIRNRGSARAWITVLDISANGEITQMYPLPQDMHAQDNELGPGGVLETRAYWYIAGPPFGTDVIKVFATRERLNFMPVISARGEGTRGGGRHPLEDLVAETFSSTRGVNVGSVKGGGVATTAITITVVP